MKSNRKLDEIISKYRVGISEEFRTKIQTIPGLENYVVEVLKKVHGSFQIMHGGWEVMAPPRYCGILELNCFEVRPEKQIAAFIIRYNEWHEWGSYFCSPGWGCGPCTYGVVLAAFKKDYGLDTGKIAYQTEDEVKDEKNYINISNLEEDEKGNVLVTATPKRGNQRLVRFLFEKNNRTPLYSYLETELKIKPKKCTKKT